MKKIFPICLNTDPKKGRIFKPGIIPAKERNSKTKRTKDRCTAQVKKKKKRLYYVKKVRR